MMIVNYDSNVVNKFGASLTDDARVIIYDYHMFIVEARDSSRSKHYSFFYYSINEKKVFTKMTKVPLYFEHSA